MQPCMKGLICDSVGKTTWHWNSLSIALYDWLIYTFAWVPFLYSLPSKPHTNIYSDKNLHHLCTSDESPHLYGVLLTCTWPQKEEYSMSLVGNSGLEKLCLAGINPVCKIITSWGIHLQNITEEPINRKLEGHRSPPFSLLSLSQELHLNGALKRWTWMYFSSPISSHQGKPGHFPILVLNLIWHSPSFSFANCLYHLPEVKEQSSCQ